MFTTQANNEQATATTITARIFTTVIPRRTDDDEIDLVQRKGPIYKFVFSGIDVFTKYLFAVPLTNGSADTFARELVNFFFSIATCLVHCLLFRIKFHLKNNG